MTLSPVAIHSAADVANAVERLLAQRPQALLVLSSPTVFVSLPRIAELARDHRLPSVCLFSNYADAGGLLSYGPDFSSMYRQLAGYVDRILKGARVGDLPIERPTKFELVINLKTAKALGLTIPQPVLQRADRVIE
jgi:putative ABC transport system substrate-binding protein